MAVTYGSLVPTEELRPDNTAQLQQEMAAMPPPGHDSGHELLRSELAAYPDFTPPPKPPAPPPPPDQAPLTDYLGKFPAFTAGDNGASTPREQSAPSVPVQKTLDYLAALNQGAQQGPSGSPDVSDSGSAASAGRIADSGQFQGQVGAQPPAVGPQPGVDMGAELGRLAATQQGPQLTPGDVLGNAPAGVPDAVGGIRQGLHDALPQPLDEDAARAETSSWLATHPKRTNEDVAQLLTDPDSVVNRQSQDLAMGIAGGPGPEAEGGALRALGPRLSDAEAAALRDQAAHGWQTVPDAAGSGLHGLVRGDFAIVPDVKPDTAANTYALVGPGGHELGGLPTLADAQQVAARLEASGVDLAEPEAMKVAAAHAINGQEHGLAPTALPPEVRGGLVRPGEPGAQLPEPAGGVGDDAAVARLGQPAGAAGAEGGGLAQDADAAARGGAPAAGADAAGLTRRMFHGTGSTFDRPEAAKFDPNGLFGPGYYLTSDPRVASSYGEIRTAVGPEYENTVAALGGRVQQLESDLAKAKASSRASDQMAIPDIEDELDWQRQAYEAALARMPSSGPNVRAVDVPAGLKLFDTEAMIPVEEQRRIEAAIDPANAQVFDFLASKGGVQPRLGGEIYDQYRGTPGVSPAKFNDALKALGYDGIEYSGGKRIPLPDDAGNPIEHQAVVVFPESLPKLRNALSGTQGGQIDAGFALHAGTTAAGGLAGNAATPEDATPEERARNIALGAVGGALAPRVALDFARSSPARWFLTGEQQMPGFGDRPDPRDFSNWMQYKQAEAAVARARGTARASNPGVGGPTGMRAYEAYLAEQEAKAAPQALEPIARAEPSEPVPPPAVRRGDPFEPFGAGPLPPDTEPEVMTRAEFEAMQRARNAVPAAEALPKATPAAGETQAALPAEELTARRAGRAGSGNPPRPPGQPPLSFGDESRPPAYVPQDQFTIRIGKNDKATAGDIRTELTGVRNAQIVRGNQLADQIKRMAPGEQNAMYWFHEAGGDPDTLRAWAGNESPLLDPYRADIEAAQHLSPGAQRAVQLGDQYYGEMGQRALDTGAIRSFRDQYQNRIYQPEPPRDFVKTEVGSGVNQSTSHAKQRVFDTVYDAVLAGKKLATTDYADALSIHNEEMARVNANRQMAEAMQVQGGIGRWVQAGKMPEGWQQVGTLSKDVPIRGADGQAVIGPDGNQVVSHSVFAAPKGIADGLAAVTDPNFLNKFDALRGVARFQGIVKTVDLSLSAFHHFTMGMQTVYQTIGQPSSLVDIARRMPRLTETLTSGPFRESEQDFARAGGITSTVQGNLDVLRSLRQAGDEGVGGNRLEAGLSKIGQLPGVSQVAGAADASTNFLFGKVQRYLKVMDYQNKVTGWVAAHPEATDDALVAAKRGFAREVNAAYGGLNWEQMGVSKGGLSAMRLALLAPDWTVSNMALAKYAVGGGTEGAAARAHIAGALAAGTLLTEGLNYLLTGHSTLSNPPGHEAEVQLGPHAYVSMYRGGIGDFIKLGSMVAESGPIEGAARFAQGKGSPIARTVLGLASNTDYNGRPIVPRGAGPLAGTADAAGFVGRSLLPVPLGASNTLGYLRSGAANALGTAAIATGIGRYSQGKEPGEGGVSGRSTNYALPPKPPAAPKPPAPPKPAGSRR